MKIKIISCNIWYARFYDDLFDFIKSEDPDVLLLQEVTSGPELQIPHGISNAHQRLIADTRMYGQFTPMFKLENEGGYELGLSILSKYPLEQTKSVYYYSQLKRVVERNFGINFPGVFASAEIKVNNISLWLITTHFIWSMYPEITSDQVEASTILKQNLGHFENYILGGDFNVTDSSEVYKTISHGLVDDRPNNTTNSLHPEIHKIKGSAELAVDYVFHKSDKLTKLNSLIPTVPVSDHLPVVVEYELQ